MDLSLLDPTVILREEAAAARQLGKLPVDAGELERHMRRALLQRGLSQPRLTASLPALPLPRLLTWLNRHRRLDRIRSATSKTADAAEATARATANYRCQRQHCWPVAECGAGRELCRCRGRGLVASAWNSRLPWANAVRRGPVAA